MLQSNHLSYEFGPYRLSLAQRVLTRDGEIISLTPKATEILVLLVENAGQLLEKDDLLKEVWPDTFVEEANLTQNIFTLRRALGDERSGPRYIETVSRRGYRFVAEVRVCEGDGQDSSAAESEAQAGADEEEVELSPPVVAVLPFVNETGDEGLEYLAEGVTDNIINNLSRVSRLRVMARSAVFRRNPRALDPQKVGKELGATAVLVGKLTSRPGAVALNVELVEVATGWQLWGDSFDCESKDLLQIQDAIAEQLLVNLKLKLSGEEEKQITARYTENSQAYQAYLEARFHWSRYTRIGIETAIKNFRLAIELDPNYALAYAAIVDCYLRLVTNYLPPEEDVWSWAETPAIDAVEPPEDNDTDRLTPTDLKIKLRFEWDWKGAERELRRANELKTAYPAAHQWYAAYRHAVDLYKKSGRIEGILKSEECRVFRPQQLSAVTLSANEEVQIFCAIAREQIEVGNYEAGCLMLRNWWIPGEMPNVAVLHSHSAADLLFTTGVLASCLSSTGRLPRGQKHAETLLSAAIGLFEHLRARRQSAESRTELALSYYRQGAFELARTTLQKALEELHSEDADLRSLILIRLAVVERHAGHLQDSLKRLDDARQIVEVNGPIVTGRFHHEFATALQAAAMAEGGSDISDKVTPHFRRALYEFVAIGHHRYTAVVQNNYGLLLLEIGSFEEAKNHLERARKLFGTLNDKIRAAQVEDTLARLYLATKQYDLAGQAADNAVAWLEESDEDALLAEALTTKGTLFCRLQRLPEARAILEGARRIAERCGDSEGAGRALLVMLENMWTHFEEFERNDLAARMCKWLENSQQQSTRRRLHRCLEAMSKDTFGPAQSTGKINPRS